MLHVLKQEVLVDTEMEALVEIFSNPLVKKYLTILASQEAHNILTSSVDAGEEDKLYVRKLEHTKGRLAVLETLLSIEAKEQTNELV